MEMTIHLVGGRSCFSLPTLRSIRATNIAKTLPEFSSTSAWPEVIVSNQGSNFSSKLTQKVHELAGIKHTSVVANGLVERYMQSLGKMPKAIE